MLQDLWIKLLLPAGAPIANPRAYLFRAANNLVLDNRRAHHRAMRRDRSWIDAVGSQSAALEDRADNAEPADEAIAARQEAEILRRAIAALPSGAQRALTLYRFENRSQGEIAAIMGISRSGVEKHMALAMKHLRNALSDCGFFSLAASEGMEQSRGQGSQTGTDR